MAEVQRVIHFIFYKFDSPAVISCVVGGYSSMCTHLTSGLIPYNLKTFVSIIISYLSLVLNVSGYISELVVLLWL